MDTIPKQFDRMLLTETAAIRAGASSKEDASIKQHCIARLRLLRNDSITCSKLFFPGGVYPIEVMGANAQAFRSEEKGLAACHSHFCSGMKFGNVDSWKAYLMTNDEMPDNLDRLLKRVHLTKHDLDSIFSFPIGSDERGKEIDRIFILRDVGDIWRGVSRYEGVVFRNTVQELSKETNQADWQVVEKPIRNYASKVFGRIANGELDSLKGYRLISKKILNHMQEALKNIDQRIIELKVTLAKHNKQKQMIRKRSFSAYGGEILNTQKRWKRESLLGVRKSEGKTFRLDNNTTKKDSLVQRYEHYNEIKRRLEKKIGEYVTRFSIVKRQFEATKQVIQEEDKENNTPVAVNSAFNSPLRTRRSYKTSKAKTVGPCTPISCSL